MKTLLVYLNYCAGKPVNAALGGVGREEFREAGLSYWSYPISKKQKEKKENQKRKRKLKYVD